MAIDLPIEEIINKYNHLNQQMAEVTDHEQLIELNKEHKKLEPQYELAKKIKDSTQSIKDNHELMELEDDSETKELLKQDNQQLESEITNLSEELLTYLTPLDEKDDKNILLEIRAGAGGDESSLFAGEMMKSYMLMAENLNLKAKIVSASQGTMGGYKEVIAEIKGANAYSWFKYEGGVHRVQRVPETEKQGRIHTSTISVAIMPLIEEDNDFKLNPDDVELIVCTSSGKGGQSVNTTYSAVQMRHKPTGLEAQSQDERDQQQNKAKALQVLTSRVYDYYEQIRLEEEMKERRSQVGRADRSEKIRTYNFPQDRLTDHRYSRNWNQLPEIMSGGVEKVVRDIKKIEAEEALKTAKNNI